MPMTAADIKVQVGADVDQAVAGLNQVDQSIKKGAKSASAGSLIMGAATTGIFAGFGLAVNGAMNYEAAMNSVQASLGATNPQMEQLGALALDIGSKTQFSATQGAQAIEELGKAGVAIPDILNGAALSAAQLASATGTDIPMAANVMANAMNTFGIAGKDSTRVADVMTAALNASSLSMNDFAAGMASAGSTAASLGIPIEDTAAALALFSNRGMSGADAGTSLRSMLSHLAAPTDEARLKFQELGISAFDAQGQFVGMESLAGQLQTQMAGLTDEQRLAALQTMFGADAMRVANILYDEGADGVAGMTKELQANGQAQAAADIRMQGLSGAMESLRGSVETAFISFGKLLLPVLTKLALFAAKLVNGLTKLSKGIKIIILTVAGAVATVGLFTGGFTALLAAMGPVGAMLAPLAAGIGALLLPFILITAAVIGLYLAFTHNFLGIRDIVMSVVDPVVQFGKNFALAADLVFGSGYRIRDVLILFPEPLRDAVHGILLMVDAFGDLWRAWQSGGLDGLMKALPKAFDQIKAGALELAKEGLHGLANAFGAIDWGALGSGLLHGILAGIEAYWPTLQGWLVSLGSLAVGAIGNLAEWAIPRGIQLLGGLLRGLIQYWPTIKSWLAALGSLAIEAIGNLAEWAIPRGIQLLGGLLRGLIEYWPTIRSWLGTLAGLAIEAIGNLAEWAVPRGIQLLGGLLRGLIQYWPTIKSWLGTLAGLAVEAIGNLAEWAVPRGIQLLGGLLRGAIEYWPTIQSWLGTLAGLAVEAIGNLAEWAVPRGIQLLGGLLRGAIEYWPTVVSWLGTLAGLAVQAIGNLIEWAVPRGIQLISGLLRGAIQQWPTVVSWLGTLGSLAVAAVGALTEYLINRGIQLLSGLYRGAIDFWNQSIKPWLADMGARALAAIPSLLTAIKERGLQAMAGVLQGLAEKWVDVKKWLGTVPGLVASAVPSTLDALWQKGWDVIQGMWNGMSSAWNAFTAWLSTLNPLNYLPDWDLPDWIPGGGGSSSSSMSVSAAAAPMSRAMFTAPATFGAPVVYHDNRTFTVDVDSLEDVATAVDVIRDLQRDREAVYGSI